MKRLFATLCLLLLALPARAQLGMGDEVAPENARLDGKIESFAPAAVKAGETTVAKVTFDIPRGWHIYGLKQGTSGEKTTFGVFEGPVRVPDNPREPAPLHHEHTFKNGNVESYDYHVGTPTFEVPLEVLPGTAPGKTKIVFSVHFMLCSDATCLDAGDIQVEGTLTVEAGGAEKVEAKDPEVKVRIVSVTPAEARKGETVIVKVEAVVSDGWHIYTVVDGKDYPPTKFSVTAGPFRAGKPAESKPIHHKDVFDNGATLEYDYHIGKVVFDVPLEVTGDAVPGETALALKIGYGLCTMEACLDPAEQTLTAKLKILEGGAAKPAEGSQPPKKDNLLGFLLLAMGTGLATLITPCVFPMIPVTISFFTKQSVGKTGGTFKLALAYGLGIMVSYTAIGFAVSALLGEAGGNTFAGNPIVNLIICGAFIVFALSLFGWFEIVLPGRLTNALSAQGRSGIIGALLLGLTFSITAFTCAAPFAASLLAFAVHGERTWALLGFLTYSGTMALPFFLLGMFPKAMKALPRSGGWLNSVKVVLGFIELAAACKFLANVDSAWNWHLVSRSGVLAFWTACSLASAAYLLGLFRFEHDQPVEHVSVPRMLIALSFGSIAFWLVGGLTGRHLGIVEAYLPLPERTASIYGTGGGGPGGGGGPATHEPIASYTEALATGKSQGKPILLEFTSFSCTNCRTLENTVMIAPEVAAELGRFVLTKLNTGNGEPHWEENNQARLKYGTAALPLVVVLDKDGNEVAKLPKANLASFLITEAQMLEALRTIK